MKLTMPWNATETHRNGISGKLDDVRRQLSDEAEHLATVAADLGRDLGDLGRDVGDTAGKATHDAGSQVANVATDVSSGASNLAHNLIKGAAGLGAAIAATGRKSVRDAQDLGREARNVRLTTEPHKTGPDLMRGVALLGGFSGGLALMYFLDPEQGRRRRALLRDQLTKWTRIGRETAAGRAKDLRNRSVGVMHETRKAVTGVAGESAADAETSMYAPTGYGEGLESGRSAQSTDLGQVPVYSQGTDYGQGAGAGYGQSGFDQPSEFDEQQNRDQQSRIEVG